MCTETWKSISFLRSIFQATFVTFEVSASLVFARVFSAGWIIPLYT